MATQMQFDATIPFEVQITSGGRRTCVVRFPSDQEWIDRAAKRKSVQHQLGRGKTRAESAHTEGIDAELFKKIATNGAAGDFDDAEAALVIDRIERAEVSEAVRDGDCFRVSLLVPGALTEHVMRMPLAKDLLEYRRSAVRITTTRRAQEIRFNPEAGAELYDKIHVSHSGYAGAVPIVHKDAVIDEVVAQINELEDEDAANPEA